MNEKNNLKILLLQIRHELQVMEEELQSFVDYSGLKKEQFDVLNVYQTPLFDVKVVDKYNALFVGGASTADVLQPEKYPFLKPSKELLLYTIKKEIPVFASCFGFQLAVLALGGEIIHQEKDFEMGSLPIKLSSSVAKDPLFYDTPDNFLAITVHQQSALTAPAGCELLAYTENCCHAFRVKNKPFWAFQFHPEVDKNRMVERLTIYKNKYTDNDDHLNQIIASAKETPESNILVKKFVDRVLLKKT